MVTTILEIVNNLLKSIPIFTKWFTKTEIDKENSGKQAVDKEGEANASAGRPSEDFWKDHPGA